MIVFGKAVKGNAKDTGDLSSIMSLLKDLQSRLESVEHDLWDMKYAVNQLTQGKSPGVYHIDVHTTKQQPEAFDDHLKEARSFIQAMVEHDQEDLADHSKAHAHSLAEFLPSADHAFEKVPTSKESAQKFMTSFDSENLLDIFKTPTVPKTHEHLDSFFLQLGPNAKVRRMSVSVTKSKRGKNTAITKKSVKSKASVSKTKKTQKGRKKTVQAKTTTPKKAVKKPAKKSTKTKPVASILLEAPRGKQFYFTQGHVAKDVKELYQHLKATNNEIYHAHVTANRNDFATWVHDVLRDAQLSAAIQKTKSRSELLALLQQSL